MLYTLNTQGASLQVETCGAELKSFRPANGNELIWPGDPRFWTGSAPVLFPVVGAARDGIITVAGRNYPMPKNGFAQSRQFALESRTENRLVLIDRADDASLAMYPFLYELKVVFQLTDQNLTQEFTVANRGPDPLWFNLGAHTGFNCPLTAAERFDQYRIQFDPDESAECPWYGPAGLVNMDRRRRVLDARGGLDLNKDLFNNAVLIFPATRSRSLTLLNAAGRGWRMDYGLFHDIVLWTPQSEEARLICVEPLIGSGYQDREPDSRLNARYHVLCLEAGQQFSAEFRITAV
jgi:galactose mutarotase-like enzyme